MGLNFQKIALYIYFLIKFERFWSLQSMGNKWDRCGKSNCDWIRAHASISYETKTIHRISSRNSRLIIPIKIYLESLLSSSSKEAFFTGGTSHWTTGSSVKSINLSQNVTVMYDMMTFFSFFALNAIFEANLFYGDFDSNNFSYWNAIILLINSF